MTIEEFIEARLEDAEKLIASEAGDEAFFEACLLTSSIKKILVFHKSWPVLVETKPELEVGGDAGWHDTIQVRMSRQIAWMTHDEYRKKFGSEPPTAPLLKEIAENWKDHSDFNEAW